MPTPTTSIRVSDPRVIERADGLPLGNVVQRDLRRYYDALDATMPTLDLSEAEWAYLADVLSGTWIDVTTATYLWADVADAAPACATRHRIDQDQLAQRLRAMPLFSRLAVCDRIERRRQLPPSGEPQ